MDRREAANVVGRTSWGELDRQPGGQRDPEQVQREQEGEEQADAPSDPADHGQPQSFQQRAADAPGWHAVTTSFLILFLAEWGDLSQLATAGFVARRGEPLSVGVGAFLALALVSALGAVIGRALLKRLRLAVIRRVGGGICLFFAFLLTLDLIGVALPSWLPV